MERVDIERGEVLSSWGPGYILFLALVAGHLRVFSLCSYEMFTILYIVCVSNRVKIYLCLKLNQNMHAQGLTYTT